VFINLSISYNYKSYFKAILSIQIDESKSNEFIFHQSTNFLIGLSSLCAHWSKQESNLDSSFWDNKKLLKK